MFSSILILLLPPFLLFLPFHPFSGNPHTINLFSVAPMGHTLATKHTKRGLFSANGCLPCSGGLQQQKCLLFTNRAPTVFDRNRPNSPGRGTRTEVLATPKTVVLVCSILKDFWTLLMLFWAFLALYNTNIWLPLKKMEFPKVQFFAKP